MLGLLSITVIPSLTKVWGVLGLISIILGTIKLSEPLVKSNKKINELASYMTYGAVLGMGAKREINPELISSLIEDRNSAFQGLRLIVIGFAMQLFPLIVDMNYSYEIPLWCYFTLAAFIGGFTFFIARKMKKKKGELDSDYEGD